jgi:deferrochelatase/peroxidase EfeB
LGLTAKGYAALGVPEWRRPNDRFFRAGMTSQLSRGSLTDPAVDQWEEDYRQTASDTEIHAVVLVGDTSTRHLCNELHAIDGLLHTEDVEVLFEEDGDILQNGRGEPMEQFGYVDGRSQPLFVAADIAVERRVTGDSFWNPAFDPNWVIVPDPAAPDPRVNFGSYFVFRKLEQNVRAFKRAILRLASQLGVDPHYVGAMIIGRFEDGTPIELQSGSGMHNPVPNDFNYSADPDGLKCPYFAHTRKVNPRGSGLERLVDERRHFFPRRGQTYGYRSDDPTDYQVDDKPESGVGLLFMAFNSNLEGQFVYTQRVHLNATPGFGPPGSPYALPDLLAGQGRRPAEVQWPVQWAGGAAEDISANAILSAPPGVEQFVTMKGGEYFFMPSLGFLKQFGRPEDQL